MNNPSLPRTLYSLLLAVGIGQWIHYYPRLPLQMASHFGHNGTANNWQSRDHFFLLMFGAILLATAVNFVIPRILSKLPSEQISLPNKSYWLAPERREETFRFISTQMGWFACGLLGVLLYATSQTIHANLPGGRFNNQRMTFALIALLLLVAVWLIRFVRHFYQTAPGQP